jgi:hypothetical protein
MVIGSRVPMAWIRGYHRLLLSNQTRPSHLEVTVRWEYMNRDCGTPYM